MSTPTQSPPKKLKELLRDIPGVTVNIDIVITGLAIDSRQVQTGDLFIAMPGAEVDGRHFMGQAVANGAAAVVFEHQDFSQYRDLNVPVIAVNDLRQFAGLIADRFYDSPSQKLTVIGVTGTNGKTTCTQLLAQALSYNDKRCAVIGTLGCGFPGALDETFNTTPDVITVHRLLAQFQQAGAHCVCMEVSSHALDQGRVNNVAFDVAVFTNLSRDHLDYHGDMKSYAASKAALFDYESIRFAVINIEDDFGKALIHKLRNNSDLKVVSYGIVEGDIHTLQLSLLNDGLDFTVNTPEGHVHVHSHLFGRFNASNLLAVLATLMATGTDIQHASDRLGLVRPVPGRVESFGGDPHPWVVVDYAHTPDALDQVLQALRGHASGKLWCVFGCGGDRDRGKRPQMGQVAERLADVVILTDDNPRNESPDQIIEHIVAGMMTRPKVVQPRDKAISYAIHEARVGDIVLIAGKGHETYQQIGDQRFPFSDRQTVNEIVGEAA